MNRIDTVRDEIVQVNAQLKCLKEELKGLERLCPHHKTLEHWLVEYKPEYVKGYRIPAENCGSDSRPGLDVPPTTVDKWIRTCKLCHKREETTQVIEQPRISRQPKW